MSPSLPEPQPVPAQSPESPYLELLARGAPAGEFEQPVLRARAAGAAPDLLAALERGRELALGVRAELEKRRRREAELSALNATAHDLAGLRDLDAVLRAIVQRARALLGTDVAYLSLNDPAAGDTYMRVTEGSVSAAFQQLRLGMGEGLGGLVAQTARPYVTENYATDPRFLHTRTIDSAVGDEGLAAILGVPLSLDGEVIGVLFAADRRPRVFEREQIGLLATFAAHAATAIETAHLIEETRAAVAELESANATIERAAEVHDRLTELVVHGGGVHDVAAALTEVLGGKVEFTTDVTDTATSSRGRADGWVTPVAAGGELLGALILHGPPAAGPLDPVDQRTLERAGMVTSLLLLARRTAGEAEQRVRGELLDDLLDAPAREPRLLRERAARVDADLDAVHVVLAAAADTLAERDQPAGRQRLLAAAAHLATTRRGLAAARDGGAVLLLPLEAGETPSAAAAQTARLLGAAVRGGVTVGASEPVTAPAAHPVAVAEAYPEARRCVEVLKVLGREGQGAAAEDFGFVGLLLAGTRDVEGFVARTIGGVVDYDRRRGTELVRTLEAYFAAGMSPARTKDELMVHVNTVAQRLERIGRLLGPDWQHPTRALEIQLALRLHRLAR
ncbi:helix-turn-helix domain-containing protein [Streptomyces polyrhachis]|uniref:Helix-turn-helix domain-containing protein n=1 Tax=Streptomyces polyrhachis TaxID=1282885 RepID=A0ABW2GCU7_9ACTN